MILVILSQCLDRAPSTPHAIHNCHTASSDLLASTASTGPIHPGGTRRGDLVAQIGVIMPSRAMDGADGSAAPCMQSTSLAKFDKFRNVRRCHVTAAWSEGAKLRMCSLQPATLYTPVAMARPEEAI